MKRDSEPSAPPNAPEAEIQSRRAQVTRLIQAELEGLLGSTPSGAESFYDLGLNSLDLTRLGSRLAAGSGMELPTTVAMRHPSIDQLTDHLSATHAAPRRPPCPASTPPGASFPQRFNQQGCFAWHENTVNKGFLHLALPIRILSPVDPIALEGALQILVTRHAALRTRFYTVDGQPVQQVMDHRAVHLERVPVQAASWSEVASRIQEAASHPFDLAHDPLVRGHLFTRGFQNHLLVIVAHHIAVDATAFAILVNELLTAYAARLAGEPAALPAVTWTLEDFAHWQAGLLEGPEGARCWDYWRQQLAGDPPLVNLPGDFPGSPHTRHEGACFPIHLEPALVVKLRALARQEGGTLYMLLLAGFVLLLRQESGRDDILVATHTQNRERPEWADLVGYLSDTVAIRSRLHETDRFTALFHQLRDAVTHALEFQGCPMKWLEKRLNLQRDALCDIWFTMLPFTLYGPVAPLFSGHESPPIEHGRLRLKAAPDLMPAWLGVWYELELNLLEETDAVSGTLTYRTDRFAAQTIARLARNLQTLLQAIVADPNQTLAALAHPPNV
ncbi:MAG: hypothetical protein HQL97_08265 [Magnetococcales bacterium]|nr:hypothetical protein [Magnetococcales bacterium]